MSGFNIENDFAKHAKEMTGSLPAQLDNKDYGKKRKAKAHKFSVKSTKTGKSYWVPAVMEHMTFLKSLLEDVDAKNLDKMTSLPDLVIHELKKLINAGAKDPAQNWSDAAELVNTAYHVANIRRPNPTQKGAWKQYEELLKAGVHALHDSRGPIGSWRSSDVVYSESINYDSTLMLEKLNSHRFFIKIPGAMDVEVDASDLSEVIRELINKIRRHSARAEVTHRTQEGAIVTIFRNDEEVQEIVIQDIS